MLRLCGKFDHWQDWRDATSLTLHCARLFCLHPDCRERQNIQHKARSPKVHTKSAPTPCRDFSHTQLNAACSIWDNLSRCRNGIIYLLWEAPLPPLQTPKFHSSLDAKLLDCHVFFWRGAKTGSHTYKRIARVWRVCNPCLGLSLWVSHISMWNPQWQGTDVAAMQKRSDAQNGNEHSNEEDISTSTSGSRISSSRQRFMWHALTSEIWVFLPATRLETNTTTATTLILAADIRSWTFLTGW